MLGRKERGQLELFITGSLRSLIPDDHVLVRVDQVLDLEWLRAEVGALSCADNGRPGIDPEVAVRLMLAGFLLGIVHDRRLMREAQVNLAIRWFIAHALHEALPDHSSLTRIRQRWGEDVFRRIFTRVVRQCQQAGMVSAEAVHIDASLIRANVSMDALVTRHLDAVEAAHDTAEADHTARDARRSGRFKTLCRTDPDATMATSSSAPLRPACKQHTAVDDLAGVVVDGEIVTGEEHDTGRIDERLDAIEVTLGVTPGRITADTIYGVGRVFAALEDRQIEAVIPPLRAPRRKGAQGLPTERFKYDPQTTWPDVRRRSGCPLATAPNPESGIVRTGAIAHAVPSRRNACPGAPHLAGCISQPSMRPSCAPGTNARHRVTMNTRSIRAPVGGSKARKARPRRSTDLPGPSAEGSKT